MKIGDKVSIRYPRLVVVNQSTHDCEVRVIHYKKSFYLPRLFIKRFMKNGDGKHGPIQWEHPITGVIYPVDVINRGWGYNYLEKDEKWFLEPLLGVEYPTGYDHLLEVTREEPSTYNEIRISNVEMSVDYLGYINSQHKFISVKGIDFSSSTTFANIQLGIKYKALVSYNDNVFFWIEIKHLKI